MSSGGHRGPWSVASVEKEVVGIEEYSPGMMSARRGGTSRRSVQMNARRSKAKSARLSLWKRKEDVIVVERAPDTDLLTAYFWICHTSRFVITLSVSRIREIVVPFRESERRPLILSKWIVSRRLIDRRTVSHVAHKEIQM